MVRLGFDTACTGPWRSTSPLADRLSTRVAMIELLLPTRPRTRTWSFRDRSSSPIMLLPPLALNSVWLFTEIVTPVSPVIVKVFAFRLITAILPSNFTPSSNFTSFAVRIPLARRPSTESFTPTMISSTVPPRNSVFAVVCTCVVPMKKSPRPPTSVTNPSTSNSSTLFATSSSSGSIFVAVRVGPVNVVPFTSTKILFQLLPLGIGMFPMSVLLL